MDYAFIATALSTFGAGFILGHSRAVRRLEEIRKDYAALADKYASMTERGPKGRFVKRSNGEAL